MTFIYKTVGSRITIYQAFLLQIPLSINHLCPLNIEEIQPLITLATQDYIQIFFIWEEGQERLNNKRGKDEESILKVMG